jgi:Fic family protein
VSDQGASAGRLVEVQILSAAGVPSPACHLLSNHYNLTRKDYLAQLRMASETGGKTIPFLTYSLNGFLEGLKGQLAHIRELQMENAWLNYVHEYFHNQSGRSAQRRKALLLDIFEKHSPVLISELDQLSPRLAKAYAGMHPRTAIRDVEALEEKGLLVRDGKAVRAHRELIASFLPTKAILG